VRRGVRGRCADVCGRVSLQAQASILSELEESLTVTSSQYEATLKVRVWTTRAGVAATRAVTRAWLRQKGQGLRLRGVARDRVQRCVSSWGDRGPLVTCRPQLYEDKIDELNSQLVTVQQEYDGRIKSLNQELSTEQVS
jgi:hypothetical protein